MKELKVGDCVCNKLEPEIKYTIVYIDIYHIDAECVSADNTKVTIPLIALQKCKPASKVKV